MTFWGTKEMSVYQIYFLILWSILFASSPGRASETKPPEPEMIRIPAGEFSMGKSILGERSDYTYEHNVFLYSYWISKFEITNEEYGRYLEDNKGAEPQFWNDKSFNAPDQPVVGITWFEAHGYCRWLSKKTGKKYFLPTEAQWEKAARGTDHRTWPWGNTFKFICLTSEIKPKPQKKKKSKKEETEEKPTENSLAVNNFPLDQSFYKVIGMAGNVSEWILDWYDPHYYRSSPKQNPTGPTTRSHKVIRGGSFILDRSFSRTFNRFYDRPDARYNFLGFRIIRKPSRN